jgi:hypothetical protein
MLFSEILVSFGGVEKKQGWGHHRSILYLLTTAPTTPAFPHYSSSFIVLGLALVIYPKIFLLLSL